MHCSIRAPVSGLGGWRPYARRPGTLHLQRAAWTRWHELGRELTTRFRDKPSDSSDTHEATVETSNQVSTPQEPVATRDTSEAEASTSSRFPDIPWNGAKVFEVMVIWLFSFVVISSQMASLVPKLLGLHQHQLSSCAQALGYFLSDVTNLLLTLFILTTSLRPYQFWEMGLFKIQVNWAVLKDVLLACASFPLINIVAQLSQSMFQKAPDTMAANLEQSITNGDFTANLVYYFVFSICTPVWEEAIFRGFLLTSLTRYMPLAGAVLASSAVFTAAHFSIERFAYLMLLGCVIGGVFVRTRNLAAPILVHSLWNFYIFLKVAIPRAVL